MGVQCYSVNTRVGIPNEEAKWKLEIIALLFPEGAPDHDILDILWSIGHLWHFSYNVLIIVKLMPFLTLGPRSWAKNLASISLLRNCCEFTIKIMIMSLVATLYQVGWINCVPSLYGQKFWQSNKSNISYRQKCLQSEIWSVIFLIFSHFCKSKNCKIFFENDKNKKHKIMERLMLFIIIYFDKQMF